MIAPISNCTVPRNKLHVKDSFLAKQTESPSMHIYSSLYDVSTAVLMIMVKASMSHYKYMNTEIHTATSHFQSPSFPISILLLTIRLLVSGPGTRTAKLLGL